MELLVLLLRRNCLWRHWETLEICTRKMGVEKRKNYFRMKVTPYVSILSSPKLMEDFIIPVSWISLSCLRHAATIEIAKGGARAYKINLMWILRIEYMWIHGIRVPGNGFTIVFVDILILHSFKMLCPIQMFNMCYAKWRQENQGLIFIFIILSNATEAVIISTDFFSPLLNQCYLATIS